MLSIEELLQEVFDDFKMYLDDSNKLCELKKLHFQSGQIPNYNDIQVQQLYLLRYMYAYAFEYNLMYDHLLKKNLYNDTISVTSIGCGNMIDYWSLKKTLKELNQMSISVRYLGIDLIDWNYKIKARTNDEVRFFNSNVVDAITRCTNISSDIYFFPKSISEFSDDDFTDICNGFKTKKIVNNTISFLISIRTDEWSRERDISRTIKLIESVKKNGFEVILDEDLVVTENSKGIKALDSSFTYPNEALDTIKMLNEYCKTYEESSRNCSIECKTYLDRWPILTAKTIEFKNVVLKKLS